MIRRSDLLILALVLVSIAGCNSCTSDKAPTPPSTPPETKKIVQSLTIHNGVEPEYIDPTFSRGVMEYRIQMAVFEGLVTQHPKTLAPIEGVATRWESSNKNKTYTFHLRKDAKWSDGTPLNAKDFLYAWERILTPENASPYPYMLFGVKNAEKFYKRDKSIKSFADVGFKALDDHTLQVDLVSPTPYFLHLIMHHSWMPVPRHAIEKHGKQWTRPGNFVGNGAFKLSQWEPQQKIVVVPNPLYWDAQRVKLQHVEFLPIESQSTAFKLYESGKIDWLAQELSPELIPKMRPRPDFKELPYLGTYYYIFNVNRKPFDNKLVRQALSMAVDRKTITGDVANKAFPAHSFVPSYLEGYKAPKTKSFNPQGARDLLAQAGYPDGKGFPKIELLYNTKEENKKIAQAIQAMWKQHLNIDTVLLNQEWKVYLKTRRDHQFDIARAAWIGDYPDPNTFLDMWLTDGGNNDSDYRNPKYDALIAKAAMETDPRKRLDILAQSERILMDDLPIMPIYTYSLAIMLRPYVKGFYPNIMDQHPLKFVYIDEALYAQK